MSARTALFLCPSNFSIGELHNAMMAGRDLLANGWGVRYMVSRRNLDYARSSGADAELLSESEKDAAAVLEHVRSLAPDLLLLADHHIWALEPTAVSIGELLELGIPTVAADSLCLGPRARTLDLAIAHLQGAESIRHWFPPTVELPPLPKGLPVIRAVPVAGPGMAGAFAKYASGPLPTRSKEQVREQLGIEPGRRLVMLARSAWAAAAHAQLARGRSRGRNRAERPAKTYYQYMNDWFSGVLDLVDEPIAVVGVQGVSRVEASTNRTRFVSTGLLSADEFLSLVAAADLYVTDNLTSGAMAQAAYLGTPVIAMQNTTGTGPEGLPSSTTAQRKWGEEVERFYPGHAFPFLVNPYGWTEEHTDLLADNPYLAAVPRAEIFDAGSLAKALSHQLSAEADRGAYEALVRVERDLPGAAALIEGMDLR